MGQEDSLANVRVLDLSRLLPGPFATMILGDLGADVVKVEEPKAGDYLRNMEIASVGEGENETTCLFLAINRNKRSITLNLQAPEGVEIFKKLLPKFDILVEQFRPGVMDRLGLGWDVCHKINPRLIYCSISGYGNTGPYRLKAGHDINYTGFGGIGLLTGVPADRNPGVQLNGGDAVRPVVNGIQIADLAGGGLYSVIEILSALIARKATGEGQFIDSSMFDGAFSLMSHIAGDVLIGGSRPYIAGTYFMAQSYASYDYYRCKDGKWLTLGILEEKFWLNLVNAIARNDAEKQKYTNIQFYAPESQQILRNWLQEVLASKSRVEWLEILNDPNQCVGPANSIAEAIDDPQVKARDLIIEQDTPAWGRLRMIGSPIKLAQTPVRYRLPPPQKGEHNKEIYGDIGIQETQIAELKRKNLI